MENPVKEAIKSTFILSIIEGIIFLLFGFLIATNPKILVYFAVAAFFIAGFSSLFFGFRIRNHYKKAEKFWKKMTLEN